MLPIVWLGLFFQTVDACINQNGVGNGFKTRYYNLIEGESIHITAEPNRRWHISRACKAKLTCSHFSVPFTKGCYNESLEVIDGNVVKVRYCGYTTDLDYDLVGDTVLDIKSLLKGVYKSLRLHNY